MILRRASIDDLHAIQRLHLQLCQNERKFVPEQSLTWTCSAEGTAYFQRCLQSGQSLVAVMVDGAEVVAYLIAVLEKSHIHWSKLESMFVQEALRRSGIGTGLTHHFLDWSRQQGAAKVTVAVAAANEAALNLYRKVGFIEVDRRGKTVILAIPKAELSC